MSGRRPNRRWAIASTVLVLGLACGSEPQTPKNLIVVLVDTLRADHLGSYGYPRATSPNLDRFARENLRFEHARSQAACTFPSVNSLLTSRYPRPFLDQPQGKIGIPPEIPSLAEILKHAGFATAAVSASPIVRRSPTRFNPGGGFDRGFDSFDEGCLWQAATCLHDVVDGLLRPRPAASPPADPLHPPFFLYLHYMDPHGPYAPPLETRRFARDYDGPAFIARGDPNPIAFDLYRHPDRTLNVKRRDLQHLVDLYDDEIVFFDAAFGRLLALLEELGLSESTMVVVASDHGEEFLEHGHIKHCRTLYDSSTLTPLMMRIPGAGGGHTLPGVVENVDVVPTALDFLGIESDLDLDGRSLRGLIEGGLPLRTHAFSAQGRWRSVNTVRRKLLLDLRGGELELFDLLADSVEQHNLLEHGARPPAHLLRPLRRWLAQEEGDLAASVDRADAALRRLESLGYLEGGGR